MACRHCQDEDSVGAPQCGAPTSCPAHQPAPAACSAHLPAPPGLATALRNYLAISLLPGLFHGAVGVRALGVLAPWYLFRVHDRRVSPEEELGVFLYLLLFLYLPLYLPLSHSYGRFVRNAWDIASLDEHRAPRQVLLAWVAGAAAVYLSWFSWAYVWSGFQVLSLSPSAWLAWVQHWAGPLRWYVCLLWMVEAGALMCGTLTGDED